MTVKHLRELLAKIADDNEVMVWLPGSRISLHGEFVVDPKSEHVILIEGVVNVLKESGPRLDQMQQYQWFE